LSYADDTLLFLRDTGDLQRMQRHLALYSSASNSKINFHNAFSLSGKNVNSLWLTDLLPLGVDKIWCKQDAEPIIYLGLSLVQSITQRESFFVSFLGNLKTTAELHSRRSLSILGRATVANSLILSKCWYRVRVLPLTKKQLVSIRSVIQSFISGSVFPAISWRIMTAPKKAGGLGILDPELQQCALYLRWLHPLLSSSTPRSIVHDFLAAYFQDCAGTDKLAIGLYFPRARTPVPPGTSINTYSILCRTMDSIPTKVHTYFGLSI
jgi:hypothetical protein